MPFRKLLTEQDVPPEAFAFWLHREILERDGESPLQVYRSLLNTWVNCRWFFNLEYDLDEVWCRKEPTSHQRHRRKDSAQCGWLSVLDPVPAGNCKITTLRQFYRLPERGDIGAGRCGKYC